jgi:hypothetical protein
VDSMTDENECRTSQFASKITIHGKTKVLDPMVCVFNDYPGTTAKIRVDKNKVYDTNQYSCSFSPQLLQELKRGRTVRTQYKEWPNGISLEGMGPLAGLRAELKKVMGK